MDVFELNSDSTKSLDPRPVTDSVDLDLQHWLKLRWYM
jgi:hypothetical protein